MRKKITIVDQPTITPHPPLSTINENIMQDSRLVYYYMGGIPGSRFRVSRSPTTTHV